MKADSFCEFDFIKKYFTPLTPYGRTYKENIFPFSDKRLIKRRYDAIEAIAEIKKNNRLNYDRVKYHLKNITYISSLKTFSDISDVFIVKKFINNYHAVYKLLPASIRKFFGFEWELNDLFVFLNPDGVSDNFYISEKYDERLKKLRDELIEIFKQIDAMKTNFKEEVNKKFSIDLKGDFVIIDSEKICEGLSDFFSIDIYDSKKVILKPKYSEQYIELLGRKEKVISEIKKIEGLVLEKIIFEIRKNSERIFKCINPILELDIAVASYEMAQELKLKRPEIDSSKISVKKGFFLPLKKLLDEIGVNYTPLSFSFDRRINIIQGSNMGGKTVVLKTIVLLQYMAQCGFFVPAEEFKTLVFERISVVGYGDEIKGLSSFAYEVYEMSEEIKKIGDKPLLIISDEFGKTTNYSQGVSIVNAVVDFFSERKNVYFFLSTHFSGIKQTSSVSFLRMKGFNREKYSKFANIEKSDIIEKIKFINKFMDYEIIKVNDSNITSSDAIEIAEIIGMDKVICNKAKKYLEESYENK